MARQFGNYPPVEGFLGRDTLAVLATPERVESYIIEDGPRRWAVGFADCTILAEGPFLSDGQVTRLKECILDPVSHYNGNPKFNRLPSVPNFAFQFWCGGRVLDVLADLHNPGWEFHCGPERYRNWNWVGGELVSLAKELFPRLASPSSRAVWREGAIKDLQEKMRAAGDT